MTGDQHKVADDAGLLEKRGEEHAAFHAVGLLVGQGVADEPDMLEGDPLGGIRGGADAAILDAVPLQRVPNGKHLQHNPSLPLIIPVLD